MSNLSERVKKAKQLRIIPASEKGCYNTYGSGDDLYKVCLKSGMKNLVTPDGYRPTKVFYTSCQKSTVNIDNPHQEKCEFCRGNNRHTVCYHCLGAIWFSLKSVGLQVSFFKLYHDAINGLNFGGTLVKIENSNGTSAVWCVYRKAGQKKKKQQFTMLLPEQKILSTQENVRLMRGSENDEGID
jgi:hypothetical protein